MNQFPTRRGLSESLEEFAARLGLSANVARPMWRVLGLDALGALSPPAFAGVLLSKCRVAPGVAVLVADLTPADVIEHDNPRIGSTLAEWERKGL